jgi:hypothetical protein
MGFLPGTDAPGRPESKKPGYNKTGPVADGDIHTISTSVEIAEGGFFHESLG